MMLQKIGNVVISRRRLMTEKELKLYKCWECGGRYYASEMTTTDKKNEVGDFCKECWKDMGEKDEI